MEEATDKNRRSRRQRPGISNVLYIVFYIGGDGVSYSQMHETAQQLHKMIERSRINTLAYEERCFVLPGPGKGIRMEILNPVTVDPNTAERLEKRHAEFEKIYQTKHWCASQSESVSGSGSTTEQTKVLRENLARFLKEYEIDSMLDIPCGDFNWMCHMSLSGIEYVGADIVQGIIYDDRALYSPYFNGSFSEGISRSPEFRVLDLITDELPAGMDLVFVRDCLVHLSLADIQTAIFNILRSRPKYVALTSFVGDRENIDIPTGNWRPLNMRKPPFDFPNPITVISEECTEDGGKYWDKCVLVWLADDLDRCVGYSEYVRNKAYLETRRLLYAPTPADKSCDQFKK